MKPTYSLIVTVFVITIAGIFYNSIYLNVLAGLFLLIIILLFRRTSYKVKSDKYDKECQSREELTKAREEYSEELNIANEKIAKIKSKYEESVSQSDSLYKLLTEFELTSPIIKKLSTVIMNKSEESTLNATEKIFTIVGENQEVSKDIQTLLADMSEGDHSLEHEMDQLLHEVEDFQIIVDHVEQLKKSYVSDMESIEKTVKIIKGLADSIADIADQTSILAINASIEAARAGNAGAGFAVIAGETQKLASDSKQITGKITSGIKEIGKTITSSFQRQSETLTSTVNHLQETKESFHQMTFNLAPQIKNIASSVEKSKDLSESVTARLGEITMSLQYQDATRQILEHIIQLIEEIQKEFLSLDIKKELESTEYRESINTAILAKANGIFTVREEWITLGLELDESKMEEENKKVDLQGDITLF